MKIERVFVASDLSEASDEAIKQGDRWAAAHGAKLCVGYVLPFIVGTDPFAIQRAINETFELIGAERRASEHLYEKTALLTGRTTSEVEVFVGNGPPVRGILDAARERKADLLVVGPDTTELGSFAERAARDAPSPVLVARPSRESGTWIAATDLSEPSLAALAEAVELARRESKRLSVMHVVADIPKGAARFFKLLGEPMPERKNNVPEARARLEGWLRAHDATDAEVVVVEGDPAGALLRFVAARSPELVVIGSRGLTSESPLGSVAETVVNAAAASVLVVRV
jgi:nucleotide-binding universal stress UspA family protein